MKNLVSIIITLLISGSVYSQTASEAFRLTETDMWGTARNLGTGNSMFAIGPELSVLTQNPSGLAGYRKGEFSFSLGLQEAGSSTFLAADRGNAQNYNTGRFTLTNLGIVVANTPIAGNWKTSNWVIGINREADYRRDIQYGGNTLGSLTDSWRENANGLSSMNLNGFEEGLAYESGAIYDFEDDKVYESDYQLADDVALFKSENTSIRGGRSEIYLGYAANYKELLYIGISANLPLVNFTEDKLYREFDSESNSIPFFNSLEYYRSINTTGFGINGKIGVTVRPTKPVLISVAAHTPTKLSLTDNYNTTVTYDFTDQNHNGPIRAESPYGSFGYALRTPWKFMGGVGIIAGQHGFLSASFEMVDYGNMRYDFSVRGNGNYYAQQERAVNDNIKNTYASTLNIRFGGEFAVDVFRLRAGATMYQSPYLNDRSFKPGYHAGLGYRSDDFFIDLGYQFRKIEEGYIPYQTVDAPQPLVINTLNRHRFILTTGFKF